MIFFSFSGGNPDSSETLAVDDEVENVLPCVTFVEQIHHTDAANDVTLTERRYRAAAATDNSFNDDADSVDIFLDVTACDECVAEVRLRHVEESQAATKDTGTYEVLDATFEAFEDIIDIDDAHLLNDAGEQQLSSSLLSIAPSISSIMSIASADLRKELLLFGQENVGPILPTTRRIYLIRLKKLRLGKIALPDSCVANFDVGSLKKLDSLMKLDNEMCRRFADLSSGFKAAASFLTRDGILRSSFNYLLLDPRLTKNLPLTHADKSEQESWNSFLSSIFYVGKGTRSRPFHHLYDALKKFERCNVRFLMNVLF